MKRKVQRAQPPSMIPTLGQVAAALAVTATSMSAHAAPDAGADCAVAASETQALRDQGKLVEARQKSVECSKDECTSVKSECKKWLAEIDARIPTIVVSLPDHVMAASDGGAGVRVLIDGVPTVIDGRPLPVNPGYHAIRYVLEDGRHTDTELLVKEGEQSRAVACPYHPEQVLGGVPPQHDEPRSGGCCGGARATASAHGVDLHAIAMAAVALVFAGRRKRTSSPP